MDCLVATSSASQTPRDCDNFLDAAARVPGVAVNRRRGVVTYDGHRTAVCAYPVSIEWPNRTASESAPIAICREEVRRELQLPSGIRLCIGVDRLDYTKGIIQKFLTVERLLEVNPQLREHFVLVQIAEPSRCDLPAYRAHRASVVETAERINQRFGAGRYRPILLQEAHHEPADVYRYLRAADVCYVGSLHDGMNLVAKEFVCARDDEQGVLVLSRFAGAATQLTNALVIDPYRTDECASSLAHALKMSPGEQSRRMRSMRSVVSHFNTHWWAARIVSDAARWRSASVTSHRCTGPRLRNDSDFARDRNRIRAR
jgi:trehalose 6-phosphate synthase